MGVAPWGQWVGVDNGYMWGGGGGGREKIKVILLWERVEKRVVGPRKQAKESICKYISPAKH